LPPLALIPRPARVNFAVITFPRRIIEELINELRRWRDFPDEISRYGTLKTWATRLGLKDAATLLDQNLQEEKKTDVLLSKLAEASINAEAA
jgi:hypothetical protein